MQSSIFGVTTGLCCGGGGLLKSERGEVLRVLIIGKGYFDDAGWCFCEAFVSKS